MDPAQVESAKRSGAGRPREFDLDAALDGAVGVFRERGYHAASIGELRAAMGLTTGSIYKAFPDKRAVFLAAFDRYVQVRQARWQPLLNAQRTGLDKIRALAGFYAESAHGDEGRQGCLVVGSATELSILDAEMAGRITGALQRLETLLQGLLQLGQQDGSIAARLDAGATARTWLCLLQGLRVVGKTGRTRAEVFAALEPALHMLQPLAGAPANGRSASGFRATTAIASHQAKNLA